MLASEPLKTRRVPKESVSGADFRGGVKEPDQSGLDAEDAKALSFRVLSAAIFFRAAAVGCTNFSATVSGIS